MAVNEYEIYFEGHENPKTDSGDSCQLFISTRNKTSELYPLKMSVL